MKLNNNSLTWIVIIGLIIFSGVATALWPTIRGEVLEAGDSPGGISISAPDIAPNDAIITLNLPVLGEIAFNEYIALLAMLVIVGALVIPTGVVLWFIFTRLESTVEDVKEDPEYQAGVSALESKEKAVVKEYMEIAPPDPVPSHERNDWILISTILTIGLLGAFVGAALSDNFAGGNNQFNYSVIAAVVGMLLGYAFLWLRRDRAEVTADGSNAAVPLQGIFLVITGIIVVGLGLAVMFWVRSQGV